jgi:hypothetical protein
MVVSIIPTNLASAAQITSRSLTLVAGVSAGGSQFSGVVNHLFAFTLPTTGNVGSIQFLYCTTASGTCTIPPGLSTTSATLASQSGDTGFTITNTTQGAPYITKSATSITGPQAVSYQLNTITNPSTPNQTFYVRISSYAAATLGGGVVDTGTVAASTATQIVLTGTMPESLIFCSGATISTTAGIPDCTTATAGTVSFNQLFSPTAAATATSQLAASTNAGSGYNITVNGLTMASGGNQITAMTNTASAVGNSEFGMNLVANSTASSSPAVGINIAPTSNATTLRGQALTGYNSADTWKFNSGDSIANSADGGAGPTNAQIYTVSYIVNVPGSQAAGVYTTTLTYVCTATY